MYKSLVGFSFVVTGNLTEMKIVGWRDDSVKQIAIEGVVTVNNTGSSESKTHQFKGKVWGEPIDAIGPNTEFVIAMAFHNHEALIASQR